MFIFLKGKSSANKENENPNVGTLTDSSDEDYSIHKLNFPKIDLTEYCSAANRNPLNSLSSFSSYPGVFLSLKPLLPFQVTPFCLILHMLFFFLFLVLIIVAKCIFRLCSIILFKINFDANLEIPWPWNRCYRRKAYHNNFQGQL